MALLVWIKLQAQVRGLEAGYELQIGNTTRERLNDMTWYSFIFYIKFKMVSSCTPSNVEA